MKALITGASSGIGRDIARELSSMGYDLFVVARRKDRLLELKDELDSNVEIFKLDLTDEKSVLKLYKKIKKNNIDIVVNNAGFGVQGNFEDVDLGKELDMLDINVNALHILTKLFLKDMKKRGGGYILNVASSAAFVPGPLMASYYASKAYVLSLTKAIYGELKSERSNVSISALCPGPVATEFNDVAGVKFSMKYLTSEYVAKYAIKKMFKRKLVIVPGFGIKLVGFFSKFVPLKFILRVTYKNNKRKSV